MQIGDVVLIAPTIGVHGGGIHQFGVVKAICPTECYFASQLLWPKTPREKLFPWVFFFDSEIGIRAWYSFLKDISYAEALLIQEGIFIRSKPRGSLVGTVLKGIWSFSARRQVSEGISGDGSFAWWRLWHTRTECSCREGRNWNGHRVV